MAQKLSKMVHKVLFWHGRFRRLMMGLTGVLDLLRGLLLTFHHSFTIKKFPHSESAILTFKDSEHLSVTLGDVFCFCFSLPFATQLGRY